MNKLILTSVLFFCLPIFLVAQDEIRWKDEVDKIGAIEREYNTSKEIVVLTGSSSARMWTNVQEYFPDKIMINTGFGGSQMHELLYFADELIIKYKPSKIFIYEGDNDISAGKTKEQIMQTSKEMVSRISASLPESKIYFISPKPSLARWQLKEKYEALNLDLKNYCESSNKLVFVDVWKPMLNNEGTPIEEIFISDGLHMNSKGYDIWAKVVGSYLK